MLHFSQWLSQTPVSVTLQIHLWMIPLIQCIHILAFCVATLAVLMIGFRILGLTGKYQTLHQTLKQYVTPLAISLCVALITGLMMIISEPPRDLMSFSFWAKMTLLAIVTLLTFYLRISVDRKTAYWNEIAINRTLVRAIAGFALLMWFSIIVLGRFIAYDSNIWGTLSHVPKD